MTIFDHAVLADNGTTLRAPMPGEETGREALSSEDLVQVLLRGGAKVLARAEHGVFLEVRRHLIFLRRGPVVGRSELRDALRAAEMGPGRFDRLLAEVRVEAPL